MQPHSPPCSGGFSLHAAVLIEAADRPAFASEQLCWDGSDQPVRYRLAKPLPTGQTELTLTPHALRSRWQRLRR